MKILRRIIIIVLIIVAGVLAGKFIVSLKEEPKAKERSDFQRIVSVEKVVLEDFSSEIELLGKVEAKNKIDIFSEVSGVLLNDSFDEGNQFNKGDVLLSIDATEFKQTLKAQKGEFITQTAKFLADVKLDFPNEFEKWNAFLENLSVNDPLPSLPEIVDGKFKKFAAGKGLLSAYYNLESSQERLTKYTITAPYKGVVTESLVKKGALIRVGQKLGEFIGNGIFEFVSEVSLSDLQFLKVGTPVDFSVEGTADSYSGYIYKINSKIDPMSQRVKVYAKLSGAGLKDGMYLMGNSKGFKLSNTFPVDRQQVKYNRLFVVSDSIIQTKQVEVLFEDEKYAYVKGLNDGDLVLVSNIKGLYEGMRVKTVFKDEK